MAAVLLQLDPPIPVELDTGEKGLALVLLDYGIDYDLLWVIGLRDSREIWTLPNPRIRLGDNITLGRPPRKNKACLQDYLPAGDNGEKARLISPNSTAVSTTGCSSKALP